MSTAEAIVESDSRPDFETLIREAHEKNRQRYESYQHDARAIWRAMDGWTLHSPEEWQEACRQADADYASGYFLVDRLGAERYLDPSMMAVLWRLRLELVAQSGGSPAERMLADMAVLSYYHALRVNGWIGNLATLVESEFFGQETLRAKMREKYGYQVEGLQVESLIARLGEQLLPLMDRASRMMQRNLKALVDYRKAPSPAVAIGQAGQVNVANQQVNLSSPQ